MRAISWCPPEDPCLERGARANLVGLHRHCRKLGNNAAATSKAGGANPLKA